MMMMMMMIVVIVTVIIIVKYIYVIRTSHCIGPTRAYISKENQNRIQH